MANVNPSEIPMHEYCGVCRGEHLYDSINGCWGCARRQNAEHKEGRGMGAGLVAGTIIVPAEGELEAAKTCPDCELLYTGLRCPVCHSGPSPIAPVEVSRAVRADIDKEAH